MLIIIAMGGNTRRKIKRGKIEIIFLNFERSRLAWKHTNNKGKEKISVEQTRMIWKNFSRNN